MPPRRLTNLAKVVARLGAIGEAGVAELRQISEL